MCDYGLSRTGGLLLLHKADESRMHSGSGTLRLCDYELGGSMAFFQGLCFK